MREIKFRAWNGDYFEYSEFNFKTGCLGCNFSACVDVDAPQQCTGLTDCNGIEIYEGDIVQSDFYAPEITCQCAVKYNNGLMRFVFDDGEQDVYEYGSLTVIGNIYENKELLK